MQAMQTATGVLVKNWEGSITTHPHVVVHPNTVDDIVSVVSDSDMYPSPVRAVGSRHSTTRCGVADGGTIIDMTNMNDIIEIGPDYVTAQAGALYIDVAKELEKHGLQFYVNVELGNLTIGSAASGGTKDASMPGEFGQVCSYAIGIKMVLPSGELTEVTEEEPELLQITRSSYGLMGIIYEVTFRVRPIQPMAVHHTTYDIEDFKSQLPSLIKQDISMMLYMYPFLKQVTVEYRKYHDDAQGEPNRYSWAIRNWVWGKFAPSFSYYMTTYIPNKQLRYFIINKFNRLIQLALKWIVNSPYTIATGQMIRYGETSGISKYTFSIWAFPEEEYAGHIAAYFNFCQDYYLRTGFRCDMLNVGYRIEKDQSSLFSYSFDGNVLTLDPVATGREEGWDAFLQAYNQFCSDRGGVPLFNQTKWITQPQSRKAFGDRIDKFNSFRQQYDPDDRLLNAYFKEVFA